VSGRLALSDSVSGFRIHVMKAFLQGVAALLVMVALALGAWWLGRGPGDDDAFPPPAAISPDAGVSFEPAGGHWPRWRGPDGNGVAGDAGFPAGWDGRLRVAWKTALRGSGHSSPVVWGSRLFVTSAVASGTAAPRRTLVQCLDRATGRILWETPVATLGLPEKPPSADNGWATPTPACNGRRVVVLFATGTMACLGLNGAVAWTVDLGPIDHRFGLAASPAVDDARAYCAVDQGAESAHPSFLIAVDLATGKTEWRTRIEASAWRGYSSPVSVRRGGRTEVLIWAGQRLSAFDAGTGAPFWNVTTHEEVEPIATPVAAGVAVIVAESDRASAWSLRGEGVPAPLWSLDADRGARFARVAGSVVYQGRFYGVSKAGEAVCHDAATGQRLWSGKLGGAFHGAPVAVAGRVVFLSRAGTAFVVKAGDVFALESTLRLEAPTESSPAVAEGRLYVRTRGTDGGTAVTCLSAE
jgi:outer membrane protein assembly factor BamB